MKKLNFQSSPDFQDRAAATDGTIAARVSGGQICFRGGLSDYLVHLSGWLKELIADVDHLLSWSATRQGIYWGQTRQSILDWLSEADAELWDGHPCFDDCVELFDEIAKWAINSRARVTLLKLLNKVGQTYFLQLW